MHPTFLLFLTLGLVRHDLQEFTMLCPQLEQLPMFHQCSMRRGAQQIPRKECETGRTLGYEDRQALAQLRSS